MLPLPIDTRCLDLVDVVVLVVLEVVIVVAVAVDPSLVESLLLFLL